MAGEKKNNYLGQYKVLKGMGGSFNSFWQKNGSQIKDQSVKDLLYSIFGIFDQDIKTSIKTDGYNQSIFDMVEMRDLCQYLKKELEEYSDIEDSDIKYTTDVIRERLQSLVKEQIDSVLEKIKKQQTEDNTDEEETIDVKKIREKFEELISKFFQDKRQLRKSKDNTKAFSEKLKKEYAIDNGKAEQTAQLELKEIKKQVSKRIEKKLNPVTKIINHIVERKNKNKKIKGPFSSKKTKKNNIEDKISTSIFKRLKEKNIRDYKIFKGKIQGGFKQVKKKFKKMMLNMFLGLFKVILSPIGNVISGLWNTIRHPIQSVKKFLKSGLLGFLKMIFSNPANAFVFGYALSFLYYRLIEKPLLKYVVNPILQLKNDLDEHRIDELENGKSIKDNIFDKIKEISNKFKEFFTPEAGVNYVLSIMYKIAKFMNIPRPGDLLPVFRAFTTLGGFFYTRIKTIIKAGMYSHFKGAGLIQKMIMLAVAQQGQMQGELLEEGDEDYTFKASQRLMAGGNAEKNIVKSQKYKDNPQEGYEEYYKARHEALVAQQELQNQLEFFQEQFPHDIISFEDAKQFFESKMYSKEDLRGLFRELTGGLDFEEYGERHGKREQISKLREMMLIRGRMARLKTALFQTSDAAIDQILVKQFNEGKGQSGFLREIPNVYIKEEEGNVIGQSGQTTTHRTIKYVSKQEYDNEDHHQSGGFINSNYTVNYRQVDLLNTLFDFGNTTGRTSSQTLGIKFYSREIKGDFPKDIVPNFIPFTPVKVNENGADGKTSSFRMLTPSINTDFSEFFTQGQILDAYQGIVAENIKYQYENQIMEEKINSNSQNIEQTQENNQIISKLLQIVNNLNQRFNDVVIVKDYDYA